MTNDKQAKDANEGTMGPSLSTAVLCPTTTTPQPDSETILALMGEIRNVLTDGRHIESTAHACFKVVAARLGHNVVYPPETGDKDL